jgi:hypothetical protein
MRGLVPEPVNGPGRDVISAERQHWAYPVYNQMNSLRARWPAHRPIVIQTVDVTDLK